MSAALLIKQLKNNNQDFEFYPTTKEIIEAMYIDILNKKDDFYGSSSKGISFLDIGAGNCKVYSTFKEIAESQTNGNKVYFSSYKAIEKSQILIDNMPKEVFVIGTDFHEQTLLDKKADYIFCNPPYSEYSQWTEKIIKEATASIIYLVIPKRWWRQKNIIASIRKRDAKASIVGEFDFLNSEDRTARAKVVLLKITINVKKTDPFKLWFDETFRINATKKEKTFSFFEYEETEKKRKQTIENQIVKAGDLITALVELYNNELNKYIRNYKLIGEIDSEVLKELKVDIKNLLQTLKDKIQGLKNLYWNEIFSNLEAITSRLTTKSRESLLAYLRENSNIDFTASNIRSVVIWVIKNAPRYFDSQLLTVYDNLSNADNARLYVSDRRFASDDWRYYKGDNSKYKLDYRIVVSNCYRTWRDNDNELSRTQMEYLEDLIVIAKNLGFNVKTINNNLALKEKYTIFKISSSKPKKVGDKTLQGKIKEVYFHTNKPNKNGERVMEENGIIYVYYEDLKESSYQYNIEGQYYHHNSVFTNDDIFTTVIGHKNGNIHFQLNQDFMRKFNLEAGRLKGWLKSPQEASEELEISLEEANSYWNSNFTLLPKDIFSVLPHLKTKEDDKLQNISKEITIEVEPQKAVTLYGKLIEGLLKIYDNKKMYGIKDENGSFSYTISESFYENKDDYFSGKSTGLSYSIVHKTRNPEDKDYDTMIGIDIREVKKNDKITFDTIEGTEKYISRNDFEEFINSNRRLYSMDELGMKFKDLIQTKSQELECKENIKNKYVETTIFDFMV